MPERTTTALSLIAAAALVAAMALPAAAQDTVDVDFTVQGSGGLSVTTTASTRTLDGTTVNLLEPQTITGTMPDVTVTDGRGGLGINNWAVNVGGTSFVHDDDAAVSIGAANARVYLDVVDVVAGTLTGVVGGMVVAGGESNADTGNDLAAPYVLLSGTTLSLLTGSVTFTPTIDVAVPAGAAVGVYRGTVTYTAT